MNKTILKNFAIDSRNKLMQDIKNKAAMLGITEEGIASPLPESKTDMLMFDIKSVDPYIIYGEEVKQYHKLKEELERRTKNDDYTIGYTTLIEEVAYTWFNRLIAIRFMEVNNYLPDKMRVLSSGREGVNEPEFVTNYRDTSLSFTEKELEQLSEWKMDASALSMDKIFQLLFIKQCNSLNDNLPELFEKTDDYAELLLTISYNDPDGVLYKLVHDIPEEYFDVETDDGNGQVEIIGWMYQYYNTEPKADVDIAIKKGKKVNKNEIPAKTQIFTPDWIVRYMVENSLGRIWIEKLISDGDIRIEKEIADEFNWEYYIPEAEQAEGVKEQLIKTRSDRKNLKLEDITFIDPAMGSFHIGVYAFDVFMQLYKSQGYTSRDAATSIIENNLYGIDIDKRAYQLSYFACMMKGRQYNKRILNGKVKANLYTIRESNDININHLEFLGNNIQDKKEGKKVKEEIIELLEIFKDAREFGSILNISNKYNFNKLKEFVVSIQKDYQVSFETIGIDVNQKKLLEILAVAEILVKKYDVIVTNPPYLGSNGMNPKLSKYIRSSYPDSKPDLFAVFIEIANKRLNKNGISALVTMQSWMFLSSYEKLRNKIINDNTIIQLMHMNNMVMRIAFGTCVTIFKKGFKSDYRGLYHMVKYEDLSIDDNPVVFPKKDNRYNVITQESFKKIPGNPIAYWASDNLIEDFVIGKPMNSIIDPKVGLQTGSNDRFIKLWHEVNINKVNFKSNSIEESIESNAKWFPYNKGGARRQWYGNYDYVVNWENDGFEIRNFKDNKGKVRSRPQNSGFYFKKSITWSLITSGGFSIRYREPGSIHDVAGMSAFTNDHNKLMYILGLMSTKIADYVFKMLNPTINLQIGDFNNFPVLFSDDETILNLVEENICIAKKEWNYYEESWGFKKHPLFMEDTSSLKESFKSWENECKQNIYSTKENEEELNRIFIELYKLEDDISPEVDLKHIKLRDADLSKDIKSFISYGVGCIFGRYSLDEEGLAYAGGEWDDSKYQTFIPTKDNVILITEDEYFEDDIVNRFIEFVRVTYGEETLEDNLIFIADALGGKGSPKEVIRYYMIKDFYKDHVKTYQKRPIYWLYDSGKQNGFKALIYMHRYDKDTTGKLRIDYLHKVQKAYELRMDNLKYEILNNTNVREVAEAEKELTKLIKQLKETKDYDEKIGHLAIERIAIDLDDGVKVNYNKVQTDNRGKNLNILAKI